MTRKISLYRPLTLAALMLLSVGACNTSSSPQGGEGGSGGGGNGGGDSAGNGLGPTGTINQPIGGGGVGGGGNGTTTPTTPIAAGAAGAVNPYTGGLGGNSFAAGASLSPNSPYVRYIGRIETNRPGGVHLSWPGSALQVRISNATNATVTMSQNEYGQNNIIGVLIDGQQTQTLRLTDYSTVFRVNVPQGDHLVTLLKRTEAGNGEVMIKGIVTDGQFEQVAPGTGRLVEFIGDNTTAGYSSDGAAGVTACNQPVNSVANPNEQNAGNTYGVLAASAFGADWTLAAFSGRGLVQNFDGSNSMTLDTMYPRLNPQDINTNITVSPNAGAVVVSVGTNDINYWMQNKRGVGPNITGFTNAYVALLTNIRALNPKAAIIATVGPTLGNYQCISGSTAADYACSASGTLPALTTLRTAVQAAVSRFADSKTTFLEFPANSTNVSSCYLPDAAGHAAMARVLIPALATATGWNQNVSASQPAAASKGAGPNALTGTFAPWPDALNSSTTAAELITNKQFPQCHYCSPQPANPNFIGTAACPTLLGTSDACQSYCHVPGGFNEMHATNPPTSGNHYSTPAVNGAEFTAPAPRGKYIHSMEHGAIVLAYNCPAGCEAEKSLMRQAYSTFNNRGAWIIFTPDPFLPGPQRFALLAWTYTLRTDTIDAGMLSCFIQQHAYYGRECTTHDTRGCSPLLDKPMGSEEG